MKILMGIVLLTAQAHAAPISDTNSALINTITQRRAETAKAQGVVIPPSSINTNSPTGGINPGGWVKQGTSNGTLKSCGTQPPATISILGINTQQPNPAYSAFQACIASGGVASGSSGSGSGGSSCKAQTDLDNYLKQNWVNDSKYIQVSDFNNQCTVYLKTVRANADYIGSECKVRLVHPLFQRWQFCVNIIYKNGNCTGSSKLGWFENGGDALAGASSCY